MLTLGGLAIASLSRPPADASAHQARAAPNVERLVEIAGELHRAGESERAHGVLRRALQQDPTNNDVAERLRSLCDRARIEPGVDEESLDELIEALGTDFRRTETARFVILSDASVDWTRQRERLLERTYHEVMKFALRLGLPAVPPEEKLVVVLFGDHSAYRAFARAHDGVDAGWVAGYYASIPNHAVFYDDRTSPAFRDAHAQLDEVEQKARATRRTVGGRTHPTPEQANARADALEDHARTQRERLDRQAREASLAKTTHEAAHLIAFNTNIQLRSRHYPFWITEGLAIAFETPEPAMPFGPNVIDEGHLGRFQELVSADSLLPLDEFVAHTDAHGHDAEDIRAEYTQAWALFVDAARYRKDELRDLLEAIARCEPGRMSPEQHRALFVEHFGDPERHERAWLRRSQ